MSTIPDKDDQPFFDCLPENNHESCAATPRETSTSSAKYVAGYKFKPTHTEVHYLRGEFAHAGSYIQNFTRNKDEARRFLNWSHAQETIDKVVDSFEAYADYVWTPVTEEVR